MRLELPHKEVPPKERGCVATRIVVSIYIRIGVGAACKWREQTRAHTHTHTHTLNLKTTEETGVCTDSGAVQRVGESPLTQQPPQMTRQPRSIYPPGRNPRRKLECHRWQP
jgi:hypothetical protein